MEMSMFDALRSFSEGYLGMVGKLRSRSKLFSYCLRERSKMFAKQTDKNLPSYRPNVLTTLDKLDCFATARNDGDGNLPSSQYRHSVLDTESQSLSKGDVLAIADRATLVRNDANPSQPSLRKGRSVVQSPLPLGEGAILHEFTRARSAGEGKMFAKQTETNLFTSKKAAFTLAEVLITLGIIGVVAAMTLPTLIQNHKKSVVETRLAKFYSVMNQAVQRAEADYGDKKNWDEWNDCTESRVDGKYQKICTAAWDYFNKYFAPYLNIVKTEESENSANQKIIAYFPDGSVATFGSTSIQFWPNGKDFGYLTNEETGKMSFNIETSGKKYFTFLFTPSSNTTANKYHYSMSVEPYKYSWDGTREELLNNSRFGCNETATVERAFCAALIQMNGWKIPKDYPLRF